MIIQCKIQWNVIAYSWIQKMNIDDIVDECGGISCALLTGNVLCVSKNIQPHLYISISTMINLISCCFLDQEYSTYYSIERNYCASLRNDHHCELKYWIIYIYIYSFKCVLSFLECHASDTSYTTVART